MSKPDWTAGPHDPVERWIETRGYFREMARNPREVPLSELECKSGFDFAETKLAECRAEMHGPGARLIALEEVWAAIGGRLLSSNGERHATPNPDLGILRDPSIAARIAPEIKEPILALFGGFAGLVRAMLSNDLGAAANAVARAKRHAAEIATSLNALRAVADDKRMRTHRRKEGHVHGRKPKPKKPWSAELERLLKSIPEGTPERTETISARIGISPQSVRYHIRKMKKESETKGS